MRRLDTIIRRCSHVFFSKPYALDFARELASPRVEELAVDGHVQNAEISIATAVVKTHM